MSNNRETVRKNMEDQRSRKSRTKAKGRYWLLLITFSERLIEKDLICSRQSKRLGDKW